MASQFTLKRSVVAVALTLASSHVVFAQQTSTEPVVQKITVTGSNIKRIDKEGTSPIQTITAKEIAESGAGNIAELMKQVPSMGADINQDLTGGTFAAGVSTASLRGLGSTSTLILLNGRRMTPSAYADPNNGNSTLYDLNSIPLSAIERVEIFKDGASAVYGSDAIGGVINFITKRNFRGAEGGVNLSANDDGKFGRKRANATFGMGDFDANGYNAFFAIDYSKRDRVARADVKDIEYDKYLTMNGRYASPYSSSVSKYAWIQKETAPGSRNFGVTRATMGTNLITDLSCPDSQKLTLGAREAIAPTSILFGRTICNYNADLYSEAQGEATDLSMMGVGSLKINENISAFAEVAYTKSERPYTGAGATLGTGQTTNFKSTGIADPFQIILPIGHPNNPFPTARASVSVRLEDKLRTQTTTNENARALAGLKGSSYGFDWETAVLWNRSERLQEYDNFFYIPTLKKINTGTSMAELFKDPTLTKNVKNNGSAEIMQWDAKATTEFGKLGGGAIGMATGVEFREERIVLAPDADLAAGNILGLSNSVIDGSRKVSSAFVEFRTPFLKNFEMDFAGRFDKYPGIKANFVPKVGAKWNVNDSLSFRGTYAEGFRAPALVQVLPGGSQFFLSGLWDPKRCEDDEQTPKPNATSADCSKSASGTGGANPDLKPETAKSFSFGLIFSPTRDFDVLVDWYKIRKEGEVMLGSEFQALKDEDRFPQNIVRDPNPVNWVTKDGVPVPGTGPLLSVKLPWINQGATEVSGLDFEMRMRNNLGTWGKLSSTFRGSYQISYKIAQVLGDIEHNVAGKRPGLYDWNLSSGPDTPRFKGGLSTNWSQGPHSVSGSIAYVGSVSLMRNRDASTIYPAEFCYYGTKKATDAAPNRNTSNPRFEEFEESCKVPDWTTVGLGYTYTGFKNLGLSINIANIFDSKAPYDPAFVTSGYNTGLHNNRGRYFTLSANYKFN
ncbi:TonB-dependent receptor [Undibacterium sp.]|uniref:TonB-dependent receptor n=1 Tax=Undibacterium sp. TaxID=1914977 RepID=UPI0037520D0B